MLGGNEVSKTASYIFLALLAIVGLGSAYGIQGSADIMAKANADTAKAKADQATRAGQVNDGSASPQVDPSYGQPSDAEGVEPEPATQFDGDSGGE